MNLSSKAGTGDWKWGTSWFIGRGESAQHDWRGHLGEVKGERWPRDQPQGTCQYFRLGGVLWDSWVGVLIRSIQTQGGVFAPPQGFISKGYWKYRGPGRQGRFDHKGCWGSDTWISISLLLCWWFAAALHRSLPEGLVSAQDPCWLLGHKNLDLEAAVPWSG